MNLEEKLKDEEIYQVADDECQQDWDKFEFAGIYKVGFVDGAKWARSRTLSICQEAVDEAKIEENRFHQKCFPSSEQQMIFTYQIFEARIKELKEKL